MHAGTIVLLCRFPAVFLPVLKLRGYDHNLVAGPGLMMVEHSTMKKTWGNLGRTRKKMAWMGLPIESVQIGIAHLANGVPLSCGP